MPPAPADDIAQDLLKIMVEEEREAPDRFNIPPELSVAFRAKMRLYREALVLMLLMSQVRKESGYEKVLQGYERLVIGPASTPESLAKLDALKAAMRDLRDLLFAEDQGRPLTWSRTWLTALGHEETNPVDLTLFATGWMTRAAAIVDLLKRLRPT